MSYSVVEAFCVFVEAKVSDGLNQLLGLFFRERWHNVFNRFFHILSEPPCGLSLRRNLCPFLWRGFDLWFRFFCWHRSFSRHYLAAQELTFMVLKKSKQRLIS